MQAPPRDRICPLFYFSNSYFTQETSTSHGPTWPTGLGGPGTTYDLRPYLHSSIGEREPRRPKENRGANINAAAVLRSADVRCGEAGWRLRYSRGPVYIENEGPRVFPNIALTFPSGLSACCDRATHHSMGLFPLLYCFVVAALWLAAGGHRFGTAAYLPRRYLSG